MQPHKKQCKRCGLGKLPAMAPLANPYVPFQMEDSMMYEPRKALVRGTLYQGLDLPFKGMVNRNEKAITPLTELQTISFAIQELALYLDTHRDDKEALAIYRNFQMLYEKAKKCLYNLISEDFEWDLYFIILESVYHDKNLNYFIDETIRMFVKILEIEDYSDKKQNKILINCIKQGILPENEYKKQEN